MITDAARGRQGEHLVKRSHAAGQSNGHVALRVEQVLSVAQILARIFYIHISRRFSILFHDSRHNANHTSASLVGSFCHTLHQSLIGTSKENRVPLLCTPPAQLLGCREKARINMLVGRAKNSNFHTNRFFVSAKLSKTGETTPACFGKMPCPESISGSSPQCF